MSEHEQLEPKLPAHHIQKELCTTRPHYRQGKKLTAVKVYTINDESQHLLFYGVPSLNLNNELRNLCLKYGELHNFEIIKKYNLEDFTECYHANFKRIQSARIAKRFLDDKSFYGGVLHVCYAPEYETINDIRKKLQQRQKDVLSRIQPGPTQLEYVNSETMTNIHKDRKRKNPALPITEKRLKYENSEDLWKDIPKELDPRIPDSFENYASLGQKKHFQLPEIKTSSQIYGPLQKEISVPGTSKDYTENVKNNLVPSAVIKKLPMIYNKNIVFKKNIKK